MASLVCLRHGLQLLGAFVCLLFVVRRVAPVRDLRAVPRTSASQVSSTVFGRPGRCLAALGVDGIVGRALANAPLGSSRDVATPVSIRP